MSTVLLISSLTRAAIVNRRSHLLNTGANNSSRLFTILIICAHWPLLYSLLTCVTVNPAQMDSESGRKFVFSLTSHNCFDIIWQTWLQLLVTGKVPRMQLELEQKTCFVRIKNWNFNINKMNFKLQVTKVKWH